MPGESLVQPTTARQATAGRRLASPRWWERGVLGWLRAALGMLGAGLTTEQISRLADLRARVQQGACADDFGPPPPRARDPLDVWRLEFARWLAQTGRLGEG